MSSPSIHLTAREQHLRCLLLDVAESVDDAGHARGPIVLRWAGGWVRDKLLGIESHDIDVAINVMTGVHFAQRIRDYCDTPEAAVAHKIGPRDIGNLHNVARNPDKSKHLETAMVKMFGLDLDFVNLRKETYAEDSRNPQVEFGSAEEDALRRDATINALFYNLHTDRIEDFTGGLPDMASKLIRTPLDPLQTFMDDPLRVLRLVRFASRLSFDIDTETERFMSDKRVLAALQIKISRERVGVELEKMLRGARPSQSLDLLHRLRLYDAIFTIPAEEDLAPPETRRWPVAYRCLDELMRNQAAGSVGQLLARNKDDTYLAWNIAAVSPWMAVEAPADPNQKASALPPVAAVAREGFKAPKKLTDVMVASHRHRREIYELKNAVCSRESFIHDRERFGMAIRRWESQGASWRLQVLSTMLVDAMDRLEVWPSSDTEGARADVDDFINDWQAFLNHLQELDVCEATTLKPLLDGRALSQALGIKPGRWMGKALDMCIAWQLRHPHATDPSGAVDEVRHRSDELDIPL